MPPGERKAGASGVAATVRAKISLKQFVAQEIRTVGALQSRRHLRDRAESGGVFAGVAFHRGLAHSIKRPCSPCDTARMARRTEDCNLPTPAFRATLS